MHVPAAAPIATLMSPTTHEGAVPTPHVQLHCAGLFAGALTVAPLAV